MLDFLFITSPLYAANPHPPYYFLALAAYLREKGLKVKIIDLKGKDTPQDINAHLLSIKAALSQNPSLFVGLSAFHNDYPMIMQLGKLAKEIQPHCFLLVGNAHATIDPQDFIYEGSPFDIAVLGEGEETCWELWQRQKEKNFYSMYSRTKGIAWYDCGDCLRYAGLVKNPLRSFMNLKDLPIPAYDLIDMDYYLKPQKLIIRRLYTSVMPIYAGRGCAWNCDFCAANTVWKANKGKVARLRSVEDVLSELRYLKYKHDLDFFYMFDDSFGMNKKWIKEWFEKKEKLIGDTPYVCQTRANLIDEDLVKGLKETGCIQVDIGVESGSQQLLDRVHKGITIQQVRHGAHLVQKYKMRCFFTLLLNLPGETIKDLVLTRNLLKELKPNGVIFGITTPYPGTKIFSDFCPQGLKKDEYYLLTGNRLDPLEQFRMAEHGWDLWELFDEWNRKFKATPIFERMWSLKPFQPLYWKTVFASQRRWQYIWCWTKDIPKTALLWLSRKIGIYQWIKGIQYRKTID